MYLYPSTNHPDGESGVPQFYIRGRYVFPADGHTAAGSSRPWFEICSGNVYPTLWHPQWASTTPWFTICHDAVFAAEGHPNGKGGPAWFTTRSGRVQGAMPSTMMIFTDWPGGGYQAAASTVRVLLRGEPVTTARVARTLCTGVDTAQHDLLRAMRLGLVRRAGGEAWVPV